MKRLILILMTVLFLNCYNGYFIIKKGIEKQKVEYEKRNHYHQECYPVYVSGYKGRSGYYTTRCEDVFDGYRYYRNDYPEAYYFIADNCKIDKNNKLLKIKEKEDWENPSKIYIDKQVYEEMNIEKYFVKGVIKYSFIRQCNSTQINEREYYLEGK